MERRKWFLVFSAPFFFFTGDGERWRDGESCDPGNVHVSAFVHLCICAFVHLCICAFVHCAFVHLCICAFVAITSDRTCQ